MRYLTEDQPQDENSVANNSATIAKLGADAQAIIITTIKNTAKLPGIPDEVPVALRRGETPEVLPLTKVLDEYRSLPKRKKGTAKTTTLQSFIDLTNLHKTEHSVIFADTNWKSPKLTSVINYYHSEERGGTADYLDHCIRYEFPFSSQWQKWIVYNGESMDQAEFAAFIEDQIIDLAEPDQQDRQKAQDSFSTTVATPAEMMTVSRGLKVNVDTTVKSVTALKSGESSIVYEETHKGENGEPVQIPGLFFLKISPFDNGEVIKIPVRLRYRVTNKVIKWFYQIYRPDLTIMETVQASLKKAKDGTKLPIYEGSPESLL